MKILCRRGKFKNTDTENSGIIHSVSVSVPILHSVFRYPKVPPVVPKYRNTEFHSVFPALITSHHHTKPLACNISPPPRPYPDPAAATQRRFARLPCAKERKNRSDPVTINEVSSLPMTLTVGRPSAVLLCPSASGRHAGETRRGEGRGSGPVWSVVWQAGSRPAAPLTGGGTLTSSQSGPQQATAAENKEPYQACSLTPIECVLVLMCNERRRRINR